MGILTYTVEKVSFRSQLDRAIRSAHPFKNIEFFKGMRGTDCSIEKVLTPAASLTAPQNTRSHSTTAPMLASLLLCSCCCSQRVSVVPPVLRPPAAHTFIRCGSSACYRWAFFNTAAAAALDSATPDEVQRHNRDDEADESSPRAKRTLCSRKRRGKDVCLSASSS